MPQKCTVVAEVGAVHLGKMERAKKLCTLARFCNADYVKFQKRNPDESTPEDMKHKPHPNQMFSYGATYLEHRKNLELTINQHEELMEFCEHDLKIGYSCSVWDMTSAKDIAELNPDFIKVGSPSNHNKEMLQYLFDHYKGGVHISLGMVTTEEAKGIVEWVTSTEVDPKRLVFYHCTSEYPVPFERIYLLDIPDLCKIVPEGAEVGFSNHGYGITLDPVAYALGANWIERHFVDDRALKHTDAAFSLEPTGLRLVCRNIKAIGEALKHRPEGILGLSEDELAQRRKLKGC